MKAKIKSTGEIIEVERITNKTYGRTDGPVELFLRDQLDFGLDIRSKKATISGWVARTQKGTLGLLRIKPRRRCGDWWIGVAPTDSAIYRLPSELFPSLTWQDDPLEVEVIIKPKKA